MTRMELETLVTYFVADTTDLRRQLKQVEDSLKQAASQAQQSSDRIEGSISGIGKAALVTAAGILGLQAGLKGLFDSVKLSAQGEQIEQSFKALVGNAQEAEKTLADLRQFALETPFKTPELLDAAKQMLAFGTQTKDLIPTMQMLGEVSIATGRSLKDLSYVYGTLKQQGRAYQRDINQFAERGIPIYRELAKVLGLVGQDAKEVPTDVQNQIRSMTEHGQIQFPQIEQAFKNLTGPGGQFFGQLEAGSKTLIGLFNNLMEMIENTQRTLGDFISEGLNLKGVVKQVGELAKEFSDFLKGLDKDTKETGFTILGMTVIVLGLAAAFYVMGTAVTYATAGLNLIVLAGVGIITAGTLWVKSIGGFRNAWRDLKQAAMEFFQFIKPAIPALTALLLPVAGYFAPVLVAIGLLIYYWDDVKQAARDFYAFIRPTLQATWSLVKVVATAIRDDLASAWQWVERSATSAFAYIAEQWKQLGGGEIDWSQVKTGLRDFVIFLEYTFKNIEDVSDAAWAGIKYGLLIAINEIVKNILPLLATAFVASAALVVGIVFAQWFFIYKIAGVIAKGVVKVFTDMGNNIAKTLETAWKDAADALAKGDLLGAAKALKPNWADPVLKTLAKFKEEVGDIDVSPKGEIQVEGLMDARRKAEIEWRKARERVQSGFGDFRDKKLIQFQELDALETVGNVFKQVIIPFMLGDQIREIGKAGNAAGAAYSDAFGKQVSKVDAILFNSAEAATRIADYEMSLPDRNFLDRTKQTVTVQPMAPIPNTAELESVEWLKKIHALIDEGNANRLNPFSPANI